MTWKLSVATGLRSRSSIHLCVCILVGGSAEKPDVAHYLRRVGLRADEYQVILDEFRLRQQDE